MKKALRLAAKKLELRDYDPHLCDLMGVLAGVKPVLYTDIVPRDERYIQDLCRVFSLRYRLPEREKGRQFHAQRKTMVLMGRRDEDLRAAEESWRGLNERDAKVSAKANIDWGVLLGYPECCVKAYLRWRTGSGCGRRGGHLVGAIAEETPLGGPLPFLLNNVFNYFSLIGAGARDVERYRRFMRLNRDKGLAVYNAISWHPCQYRCKESLYRAGVVYGLMRHYFPAWADAMREKLARPMLCLGKYEFAVFSTARARRTSSGGLEVEVGEVAEPRSLLSAAFASRLVRAGGFTLKGGRLSVAGKKVPLSEPAYWLDFRGLQGAD
ncbi:MAG: hypothetical protein WC969_13515 [Elusimicrobiota bacterium]|jgi:hypothetical protein